MEPMAELKSFKIIGNKNAKIFLSSSSQKSSDREGLKLEKIGQPFQVSKTSQSKC